MVSWCQQTQLGNQEINASQHFKIDILLQSIRTTNIARSHVQIHQSKKKQLIFEANNTIPQWQERHQILCYFGTVNRMRETRHHVAQTPRRFVPTIKDDRAVQKEKWLVASFWCNFINVHVKIHQFNILGLVLEPNTRKNPGTGYFGTRQHVSQTARLFPQ